MFSLIAIKSRTFSRSSCSASEQVFQSWEGAEPQQAQGGQRKYSIPWTLCLVYEWRWPGGGSYRLFSFLGFFWMRSWPGVQTFFGLRISLQAVRKCVLYVLFCIFIFIIVLIFTIINIIISICFFLSCLLKLPLSQPMSFPFCPFLLGKKGRGEQVAFQCIVASCRVKLWQSERRFLQGYFEFQVRSGPFSFPFSQGCTVICIRLRLSFFFFSARFCRVFTGVWVGFFLGVVCLFVFLIMYTLSNLPLLPGQPHSQKSSATLRLWNLHPLGYSKPDWKRPWKTCFSALPLWAGDWAGHFQSSLPICSKSSFWGYEWQLGSSEKYTSNNISNHQYKYAPGWKWKWKHFCVGSNSAHVWRVLHCSGKVIQQGHTPL